MRRHIGAFVAALALAGLVLAGGCESWQKVGRHVKSGFVGLPRIVTLFDAYGQPIRTWEGQFMVECSHGYAQFITDEGLEMKICGTIIIEETGDGRDTRH